MEDWITIPITFLSAVLGGLISLWYAKRSMFSAENMDTMLENATESITTNENVQKRLYYTGAVLGNGFKQGFGIMGKGGKFKWEDFAAQVLPGILGKVFGSEPSASGVASSNTANRLGKMPWEQ